MVQPNLIYYFKNGIRNEIKILISGVTKINNIGVVNDERNVNMDYDNEDWLAIATDNGLFSLFRNSTTIGIKYKDTYQNPRNPKPGYRLTNSSFKYLDIQIDYPDNQRCYLITNYQYLNRVGGATYINILPEEPPFSAKVNCTLFELDFNKNSTDYYQYNCLWGSNDGIFAKRYLTCSTPVQIFDKPVNDLEEIDLLFHLRDEKFILAGSDEGLYYSNRSLRSNFGSTELTDMKFLPFGANEKINSISTEINLPGGNTDGQNNSSYCEKVVWLATANGIKELSVNFQDEYYEPLPLTHFLYFNVPEGVSRPSINNFVLCNGQSFQVGLLDANQRLGRIFINWFKDGLAVPEWAGNATIQIHEKGTYHCELTAICENIKLTTQSFTVEETVSPQFSFPYASEVKLCENQSFPMETTLDKNYKYQWFKNDSPIAGAMTNKYTAVTSGIYRVEVSNCAASYVSSSTVTVGIDALVTPLISSDKSTYCSSDLAVLSVANPLLNDVHWYFNGTELLDKAGVTKIQAPVAGKYEVEIKGAAGCSKRSEPYELILHTISAPLITMSSNKTLCYGETVKLSVATEPGATYVWNTRQTGSNIEVTESGRYFVEMVNQFGCEVRSAEVTVKVGDKISLSSVPDVKICTIKGESLLLKADPGYASYTWNGVKGTNETLTVKKDGQYRLEVEDANGCKAVQIFAVLPWCDEISMPNAFSPNGDGVNDHWIIYGLESDPKAQLEIINRFGQAIFTGTGKQPVWDGKYKGSDVPIGVYYYRLKHSRKGMKDTSGTITLIR